MMNISDNFQTHLASGATTLCRCWVVERADCVVMGFTDHDAELSFDGYAFRAQTGMTARALSQTTGLSVDNSEAVGALTDDAMTEGDILAGRYDQAAIRAWLVNWSDPADRILLFSGSLGEITRKGGAFQAELRGLTEALNKPQGRVYQRPCGAVLGDGNCRFDLSTPGYTAELAVDQVDEARVFSFAGVDEFEPRWFESGRLVVLSGQAAGLIGTIKNDRFADGMRRVELWESLRDAMAPWDMVRLVAGCDRRSETCRVKFNNIINFYGFPHVPGEDWLVSYPVRGGANNGGSMNR
ncbi:DUF2163 domain-containing protein [Actibacterium lipolyticum]|uniref:Bacteriophage phiJL001 Gp84 C-terminal domain-containing protein n=1 Tax=Actibacterium lipolyticum TaxID=1524263 RepID=A0A238KGW5_9RHOB|nr:DUF2163 domain-containing protein [Actibacterium lipolyticum]SMX42021.1 hypothetical protein COL8621_01873 [Actibacterium lipolyticum]